VCVAQSFRELIAIEETYTVITTMTGKMAALLERAQEKFPGLFPMQAMTNLLEQELAELASDQEAGIETVSVVVRPGTASLLMV
jgi:hypothetical protein